MQATLKLSEESINLIAKRVLEGLRPIFKSREEEDQLLSIDQVASLLDKSKEQIYQWVNKSQHGLSDFPYMKAGRSLRFSQREVLQWMKSRGKPLERR